MTTLPSSLLKWKKIYLDNNATTPLDPKVFKEMSRDLSSLPLNPSSPHAFGRQGKQLLISARQKVANFLQVDPSEILFTSGGTESMNLLIKGAFGANNHKHIITTNIEHASVHHTIAYLEKLGASVTYLSTGTWGTPTPEMLQRAITPQTALIVFSAVNSETGVKLDMEPIASIAYSAEIPLIIDGIALLGKERFTISPGVTGMGFSSHKIHGPKGVGCVFVRNSFTLHPQMHGGFQERNSRPGTENLAGILGFAQAIEILKQQIDIDTTHMENLRDLLEKSLCAQLPFVSINGEGPRICNISNLFFEGIDGETLFIGLDIEGIATSQGSACSSGALEPSRVLRNMGYPKERAKSSLRFSVSRMNTKEEIQHSVETIIRLVKSLRHTQVDSKIGI